jgi:WD40 repeat protein
MALSRGTDHRSDHGGAAPTVAAIVLVLALGLGAGWYFLFNKHQTKALTPAQPGGASTSLSAEQVMATGHGTMASAVFSPDGKLLGAIGEEKNVYLFDDQAGTLVQQISEACCTAESVAFSPDGEELVVGMNDSNGAVVLVLGWQDGKFQNRIREIHQQGGRLYSAVFAGAGQQLLTEIDSNAVTWDIATGAEVRRIEGGINGGICALSRGGDIIATGGVNHNDVTISDAANSGTRQELAGHTKGVLALAISPDGNTTASGSYDSTVRLWNTQTAASKQVLQLSDLNCAYALAFSNSGKMLATGGDGVRIWDPATGVQQRLFASKETSSVAFSPDDHLLAATSAQGSLTMWRLQSPSN